MKQRFSFFSVLYLFIIEFIIYFVLLCLCWFRTGLLFVLICFLWGYYDVRKNVTRFYIKKNRFITYKRLKIQGQKLTMRQEIMFSLYWYCSSSAFLKKFACGTFLILFLVFLIWNFYVLFQNFIFLCILVSEFKREGESPKIKQQKREKPSKKRETIKKERKRLVTQILWEKSQIWYYCISLDERSIIEVFLNFYIVEKSR